MIQLIQVVQNIAEFVQEHDYIKDKWGYMLYNDRFYDPNLSLKKAFVLDKE